MRVHVHPLPLLLASSCSLLLVGCSKISHHATAPPAPTLYSLTVSSTGPATGVAVAVTPLDASNTAGGTVPFTRRYAAGSAITLTSPPSSAIGKFGSWTGCTSATGNICVVTLSANATVTANYTPVLVAILPNRAAATIGQTLQLTVTVDGSTSQAVIWSLAAPKGWTGGLGSVTNATSKDPHNGLYTTPYPAPANVVVTATSVAYPGAAASREIALTAPSAARGPELSVDAGNPTHAISALIYGMNFYSLNPLAEVASGMTIDRFGGDGASRYNYLLDVTNSASDWFFENTKAGTGLQETGQLNTQFLADRAAGVKTIATVNVLGWVAKDSTACSFPISAYPSQHSQDPYGQVRHCGDGETPDKNNITGNDATDTSIAVGPSFAGDWTAYLVGKFGNAASGGVAMYSLDNEPAWWDAVHRDVHPVASTYDEVTENGIATAEAIKTADPTAAVTGPVVDNWWNYFYSKKDMESGWKSGPCHKPWSNPVDRDAHHGVAFVEWYLQQMKAAESTFGERVLDYLDLHTYYAGSYNGNPVGLAAAGDTGAQQMRLNSTRAFWDPTYTDPEAPQPNYSTDTNFTANCSVPLQAPQLIPMMKTWITNNYPGTRTAITEYNWGGQENINGAVAQADLLGIFGREALDLATLWGPPDPVKQMPGLMAFEAFRNYDGAGSKFGDVALYSTSAKQAELSIYGARRTSDRAITVIVLNKTYGDLSSTIVLKNLTAANAAKTFLYSNADLAAIVAQPDVTLTHPGAERTVGRLEATFPAQSITIFVIPDK